MNDSSILKKEFGKQIFKERPPDSVFDFFGIVYHKLLQKANHRNFLSYSDVYRIFGQTFCFPKQVSKQLLTAMQSKGLLTKEKRGIFLC